ncbi:MAG: type II secretion system minor pseudopilin GspI [Pseudomonadota bacterium]
MRANPDYQSGFTLLEVLVATAILGLISLAALKLAGAGVDTARHMAAKNRAMIVAENALVDILLSPGQTRGTTTQAAQNMGKRWQVTQRISPTPDARVLQVEIEVSGPGALEQATLKSFKVLSSAK